MHCAEDPSRSYGNSHPNGGDKRGSHKETQEGCPWKHDGEFIIIGIGPLAPEEV